IMRRKAFAASLLKMKVYIEDHATGHKLINHIPCTKLGALKNGETKTFSIGENAARVYVIGDNLSKNYCNDFFEIPAGAEDIFLSGENVLDPVAGNAFRFDGISSENVLKNRKKGTKKGIAVLVVSVIIGVIIGTIISMGPHLINQGGEATPKDFRAEGMQITLTNQFREAPQKNYTACYGSKDIAVLTLKESFSLMDGFENYTLDEYADLVLKNNGLSSDSLKKEYGLTYFDYEFTNPNTNETYYYFSVLYKANDAFWMIQFAALTENTEEYIPQFVEWANSVKFSSQSANQTA
ncbi:MAG: hypothetical protein K2L36_06395, partial [Eubacterium sp.]|nr:hypothetical protein [Eubacterium sp.]